MENDNNESISTAESFNILTWQQIVADEKLDHIIPVIKEIYEEKSRLRKNSMIIYNDCNFNFYDMHDAKMLYLMTQHLLWNRKNHPFLLCKCSRGDGVLNNNHVCKIIDHNEQVEGAPIV